MSKRQPAFAKPVQSEPFIPKSKFCGEPTGFPGLCRTAAVRLLWRRVPARQVRRAPCDAPDDGRRPPGGQWGRRRRRTRPADRPRHERGAAQRGEHAAAPQLQHPGGGPEARVRLRQVGCVRGVSRLT